MWFPAKKNPWVAFGLLYLLIELFYMSVPVVQKFGWGNIWSRDEVTKFSYPSAHESSATHDTKRNSVVVKWRAVQYICLGPLASLWESHVVIFLKLPYLSCFKCVGIVIPCFGSKVWYWCGDIDHVCWYKCRVQQILEKYTDFMWQEGWFCSTSFESGGKWYSFS